MTGRMIGTDTDCSEEEEGVREGHCFHDLPATSKHFPGSVCCFCGDIFAVDWDEVSEHGEYLPKMFHHKKLKLRKSR